MIHRAVIRRAAVAVACLAVACLAVASLPGVGPAAAQAGGTAAQAGVDPIKRAAEPIPGRYIVQLTETPITSTPAGAIAQARRLADAYSARVVDTLDIIHGFVADMDESEAEALAADPGVAAVEEDGVVHASTVQSPAPSWGLDRIDQANLPLDNSYSYDTDGTGVTAYVIDTGILPAHVDFAGRAVQGADCTGVPDTPCLPGTALDCNGHGTHVAGIIGGTTYGVAKNVALVAVRVLNCAGSGTISGVVAGIDWVTSNHDAHSSVPAVANLSLGGSRSPAMNSAVETSIAHGVSYAIAAGNGVNDAGPGIDAQGFSPASAPDAVTVGATDTTDTRASFSNFGSCVDVFAPGVSIKSDWSDTPTSTKVLSGTSMASPHVAGVIARYLQSHPTASPATVVAAITQSAGHKVSNAGAGSPDLLLSSNVAAPTGPAAGSCGGEYTPVSPRRVLDTRGDPTLACPTPAAKLGPGEERTVSPIPCAALPATGVAAVVVNVTVDGPSDSSYVTVYPRGATRPFVSNLNFVAGQTVANLATVKLGVNGDLAVSNFQGATDVVMDVVGWYSVPDGLPGGRFVPAPPVRILDTRGDPNVTCNPAGGAIGPNATRAVHVTGGAECAGSAPVGAVAVVANVTATQPTTSGYLTAYPGDVQTPPPASTLNFVAGLTVPNLAIVKLAPDGTIKLYNHSGLTHVVVDVMGWYVGTQNSGAGLFVPLAPNRVLDTRVTGTPVGPGQMATFVVAGTGGVPSTGASSVVMNTTVTNPTSGGYLTVFPASAQKPNSSNLNFVSGQTVPNLVMSGLSPGGAVKYYNFMGFTDVIFDVSGYFTAA